MTTGQGVDAQGGPVIDPTANVTALVKADSKHTREIIALHAASTADRLAVHERHAKEIRDKESGRIDAILKEWGTRRDAESQAAQVRAAALETQVVTLADATRKDLQAQLDPIRNDIAEIRKYQDQGQGGKIQVQDSQAKSGSVGLWLALAVTALLGVLGAFIGAAGLVYTVTR